MKIAYTEKEKSDFAPFMLLLEFDTQKDFRTFYSLLQRGSDHGNDSETEMFKQINDAITLKITK